MYIFSPTSLFRICSEKYPIHKQCFSLRAYYLIFQWENLARLIPLALPVRKFFKFPGFLMSFCDFSHCGVTKNSGVGKSRIFSHPQVFFNFTTKTPPLTLNQSLTTLPLLTKKSWLSANIYYTVRQLKKNNEYFW